MPRDSNGIYTLPVGNPVVSGTVIESVWANTTLSDVAQALTNSLPRDGSASMTGTLQIANGNLSLSGTGQRIVGDFSNATHSSRLLFQSNVANGQSLVGVVPNGTSQNAGFIAYSGSDPNNASLLSLTADGAAGGILIGASKNGTGAFLPMVFSTGGTECFRLSATGNRFIADFSNSTIPNRFLFQSSATAAGDTSVGALPSTTGAGSNFICFAGMDSANAAYGILAADPVNVQVILAAGKTGTGVYYPLTFQAGGSERMRVATDGSVNVGNTTSGASSWLNVVDFVQNRDKVRIHGYGAGHGVGAIYLPFDNNNPTPIQFQNAGGSPVGAITTNASATTYATSSDYRLKKNVRPMVDSLTRLLHLNPVWFDWKADDSEGEGFIAHELQEVVPQAVAGEKDGEMMQGVDYGKVVPLLVAAVQELAKEVAMLKTHLGLT